MWALKRFCGLRSKESRKKKKEQIAALKIELEDSKQSMDDLMNVLMNASSFEELKQLKEKKRSESTAGGGENSPLISINNNEGSEIGCFSWVCDNPYTKSFKGNTSNPIVWFLCWLLFLASRACLFLGLGQSAEWASLVIYFSLMPYQNLCPLTTTCIYCAVFQVLVLAVTYIRSLLDSSVTSLRSLELGFLICYACLFLLCSISANMEYLAFVWSNALIDLSLTLILYAGVLSNSPFILPYAMESGLPSSIATQPYMIYQFNKATMEWVMAAMLMTMATMVAPSYLCFVDGADGEGCFAPSTSYEYNLLNVIFTYYIQMIIATLLALKQFWWDAQQQRYIETWVMRSKEQVNESHGVPFVDGNGNTKIKGRSVRALTNVPTLADGKAISKELLEELTRASKVLARAFVDDPLFQKWPDICTIENREEKTRTLENLFDILIKGASPLNHTFVVSGSSYCVCIPCWPRGDESDLFYASTLMTSGFALPPIELARLADVSKSAVGNREHLYIAVFGTDPGKQGLGLGTSAIKAALSVSDARGVPACLETCTLKNKRLYESYGFTVVANGEMVVEGCEDPWFSMIREPPSLGKSRYVLSIGIKQKKWIPQEDECETICDTLPGIEFV